MRFRYSFRALTALLVVAMTMAFAPELRADSLASDVIGLFPRDVGEFAYVDLSLTRGLPWFAQFSRQMLPGRFLELEDFLSSAKVDSNTQIQAAAWAQAAVIEKPQDPGKPESETRDEFIGVVLGQFSPDSAEAGLNALKLQTVERDGYTLYPCGNGAGTARLY